MNMDNRRRTFLTASGYALGSTLCLNSLNINAQSYPDKPVKIIMPFAAGNTLDVSLRQVGELFTKSTGQPLIIENKPGGAGFIAAIACAQAVPDG